MLPRVGIAIRGGGRAVAPRLGTRLAGGGDGIELPTLLAGFCIEGCDESANAVFAAAHADDDFVLDGQRSHGEGVAGLAIRDIRFPEGMTALGIDGHQVRVERAHVKRVAQNRDAPIIRAAADGDFGIVAVVVDPEDAAGNGIERDHVIRPLGHVHDSVNDQGGRFPTARDSRLIHPRETEVLGVGRRNLSERTKPVTEIIAAIRHVVLRLFRGVGQAVIGDGGLGVQAERQQCAQS